MSRLSPRSILTATLFPIATRSRCRMGVKYLGVCPPQSGSGFLAGYEDCMRGHAAEEHSDEIRRDGRSFEKRMDDIEDELDDIADQLGDSGLESGERDSL